MQLHGLQLLNYLEGAYAIVTRVYLELDVSELRLEDPRLAKTKTPRPFRLENRKLRLILTGLDVMLELL